MKGMAATMTLENMKYEAFEEFALAVFLEKLFIFIEIYLFCLILLFI